MVLSRSDLYTHAGSYHGYHSALSSFIQGLDKHVRVLIEVHMETNAVTDLLVSDMETMATAYSILCGWFCVV